VSTSSQTCPAVSKFRLVADEVEKPIAVPPSIVVVSAETVTAESAGAGNGSSAAGRVSGPNGSAPTSAMMPS
jgi:hypothetical protein